MNKGKARKIVSVGSGIFMLVLSMSSLGISTYAWFQAEAAVHIETNSDSAEITVSAPEGAKFFYFKGNGTPGSSNYHGYSPYGATVGNITNVIDPSNGKFSLDGGSNYITTASIPTAAAASGDYEGKFENDAWAEIDGSDIEADDCFDFSKMRPGCHYTFCASYKTAAAFTLTADQFDDSIGGEDVSPYRYLYDGSSTTSPLSLAQIINSYSYISTSANVATDTANYIKKTAGGTVAGMALSGDGGLPYNSSTNPLGIGYDGLTAASKSIDYVLASNSLTTDTTYFVFFTIYMESDKTNALVYNSTSSGNYRYTKSSSGNYLPYNGLAIELTKITISSS